MKHLRKIVSILLTAIMVLAMCIPVMADGINGYTITINNSISGHTYQAYQIFSGKLSTNSQNQKVLSDIDWGNGITDTKKNELGSAESTARNLADSDDAAAFAKAIANNLQNPIESTFSNGVYAISGLAAGYYLIKDKDNTLTNADDYYTAYIMEVVGNVTAEPKGNKPTLNKQIKHNETDTWGVVGDNQIGDTVYFRTITSVPDTKGYTTYSYVITDTMSAGLTSNVKDVNNVRILINDSTENVLETKYYTVKVDSQNSNKFTVTVDIINAIKDKKIEKNQSLYTYYDAILNKDAIIYDQGKQDNTAYLEYSNNPNNNGEKGKTPNKIVYDWTFKMGVKKVNAGGEQLSGAKFVLSKTGTMSTENMKINDAGVPTETSGLIALIKDTENNTYTIAPSGATNTTYVIETGNAIIKGLDDSVDYYLYETKSPEGYNLLKTPVQFKINVEYNEDGSRCAENKPTVTVGTLEPSTNLETEIVNESGSTLPSTGGIGTTIFYIVGVVLVLGAGVLLVTKKRMNADK